MKISASDRVQVWLQNLSPQTRRDIRVGLKLLSQGKGDVKALQRDLEGYYRPRVGAYRIIFRYSPGKSGPECFAHSLRRAMWFMNSSPLFCRKKVEFEIQIFRKTLRPIKPDNF